MFIIPQHLDVPSLYRFLKSLSKVFSHKAGSGRQGVNFERLKKTASRYYLFLLTLKISRKYIQPSLRNLLDKKGEKRKP